MPLKHDEKLCHEQRPYAGKYRAEPAGEPDATAARPARLKDNRADAHAVTLHAQGVAGFAFRTYLDNCDLPAEVRERALAIYKAFPRGCGKACPSDRFAVVTLLAREASWGDLSRWTVPTGVDPWNALVHYILGPWPVPGFLFNALARSTYEVHRTPWELGWVVDVARTIARGESLTRVVGTRTMPVPLTRRMIYLFQGAARRLTPIEAVREAQTRAAGGALGLGELLCTGLLGQLQGPDPFLGEPWWATVIAWMARNPGSAEGDVSRTLSALRSLRARSSPELPFTLTGRTRLSVKRLVEEETWRLINLEAEAFPTSGLRGLVLDDWEVVELGTAVALAEEGAALHHCAGLYTRLCTEGVTTLWSVRQGGERRVTVEVVRAASRVAQVRGDANRAPTEEEAAIVTAWAAQNGLVWEP